MHKLSKDPKTGMLISRNAAPGVSFTPALKLKFLDLYRQTGNITKSIKAINIDRRTLYVHLQQDEVFQDLMKEAVESFTDDVEQVLLEQAKQPKSFLDRIAWLKAHRPNKYADKVKHEHQVSNDRLLNLLEKAKEFKVIDAKLVEPEIHTDNGESAGG